ncbi:hypothetical protein [Plantactinospora sp. GCM10030261]|uniref:hypothetical protein n=1 Tax=Plantactinospora sp. GCM10030261 TaxID=3273420 RepID=UPI0036151E05
MALSREQERQRPLYSRTLGLRHVDPGAVLCFMFFEGSIILALLLALAELVSWWTVLVLPATVAALVKLNDEVAAAVARSAARVPQKERERFRRQMAPAVGRAAVPRRTLPADHPPADHRATSVIPALPVAVDRPPSRRIVPPSPPSRPRRSVAPDAAVSGPVGPPFVVDRVRQARQTPPAPRGARG